MVRMNDAVQRRLQATIDLDALWGAGEEVRKLTARGLVSQCISRALLSIKAAPFTSCMTLATMIFSLFVFSIFLLLFENINRALIGTQGEIAMSVFLKEDISKEVQSELEETLRSSSIVRNVTFVGKEKALENFKEAVGKDSPLIEGLEGANPLPASYQVLFRSVDDLESLIGKFSQALGEIPGVEHVEYSRGLVSAVVRAIKAVQGWGALGICIVLLMSAFIITVAIRLALYSHRQEIEIMYLVGADKTFIRAPYLVEGMIQGVGGALVSLAMLFTLMGPIRRGLSEISVVSLTVGEISYLGLSSITLVLALGFGVGTLASYLAVKSHLGSPQALTD